MLNLFENPIVADIDGLPGPEVIKGGVTLNQLVNIGVAVGQNLPYNHVVQAWNAQTGASLPSFPQAVEDFQLLSSPSVADVSDATGKEILVGTGLYYLRNINVAGVEGTGWPKFTGGWLFATPAIGDTDGDGKLDVTALTREGNAFSWRTDQDACGTNDEWWTSRHDEWNTGAYGTDSRPPGTPEAMRIVQGSNTATVSWDSPGDDWLCGQPTKYRIIQSTSPDSTTRPTARSWATSTRPSARVSGSPSWSPTSTPRAPTSPSSTGTTTATGDTSRARPTVPAPRRSDASDRSAGARVPEVHEPQLPARHPAQRAVVQLALARVVTADHGQGRQGPRLGPTRCVAGQPLDARRRGRPQNHGRSNRRPQAQ